MSGDLLSGGIPKKLIERNGHWTMHVVRQVAIDRSIYRPHTQELEGPDVIIRYLQRMPQFSKLAATAVPLLQSPPGEKTRSFDAVNGEWVPSVLAPSYIDELKRKHRQSSQHARHIQLLEVKAECMRLRSANNSLRLRVEELEKKLALVITDLEEVKAREPVVVQAPAEGAESQEAQTPVDAPPESAEPVKQPPVHDGSFEQVKLPAAHEFVRCIEQLIGSDVTAKETTPGLEAAADQTQHVAIFVNDEDVQVAAVLMDLTSTVYLGGTLLMVPEGELKSQVEKKAPSEDSIAASSEVCNALSGTVNMARENPHVRALFLEPLDLSKAEWLQNPSETLTLEDTLGGKMLLAAR